MSDIQMQPEDLPPDDLVTEAWLSGSTWKVRRIDGTTTCRNPEPRDATSEDVGLLRRGLEGQA